MKDDRRAASGVLKISAAVGLALVLAACTNGHQECVGPHARIVTRYATVLMPMYVGKSTMLMPERIPSDECVGGAWVWVTPSPN